VALFHRASSNLYDRLQNRFLTFRYFDLMTPPDEATQQMDAFGRTFWSAAHAACPLRPRAKGRAAPPPAGSHHLGSRGAGVAGRCLIAEAFDLPAVHQIYQCTEGLLAVSCAHGRLHLQEDIVAIQTEPLEEAKGNEPTRVSPIVTDLWRRTQPILRYRLGDVLALAPTTAVPALAARAFG
jgi:phenylacetate-CoA ligase